MCGYLLVNDRYMGFELRDRFSLSIAHGILKKVINSIFHLAKQKAKRPNLITRDLVGIPKTYASFTFQRIRPRIYLRKNFADLV